MNKISICVEQDLLNLLLATNIIHPSAPESLCAIITKLLLPCNLVRKYIKTCAIQAVDLHKSRFGLPKTWVILDNHMIARNHTTSRKLLLKKRTNHRHTHHTTVLTCVLLHTSLLVSKKAAKTGFLPFQGFQIRMYDTIYIILRNSHYLRLFT